MKHLIALTLVCGVSCLGQSTSGACSPIIQSGAHVTGFTLTCKGMSDAEGKQLLDIINQIAKNQLNPKLVMSKLDEIIKAQQTQKLTTADISDGVKSGIDAYTKEAGAQVQAQMNNPRKVATDSYQRISDFLDTYKRQAASLPQMPQGGDRILQTYQTRFAPGIHNLLELRARRGLPVTSLVTLSANVKSTDDIRQIADALQKMDSDPLARSYASQLTNLLNMPSVGFNGGDFMETQTVNNYLSIYRRTMSNNLETLKGQNIQVDDLLELNQNIKTTADIRKLADGLKKIADSLPQ